MQGAPALRLSFLGGAGSIGASCALVRVADTSLVIDCGVRFRKGAQLPDLDALRGASVDAVLLTHAHSDHSGALPVLHEAFPSAPIHLTPPTAELVTVLQRDAILITGYQDEESPGAALLKLAASTGPRQLKVGDGTVDVRCRFSSYSLSAHADRMQMVGLLTALRPSTVVLVHGDPSAKAGLSASLDVDDIVAADDGDVITRSYRPRALPAAAKTPMPSPRAAAALVGGDPDVALSSATLAEAWFGRKATDGERRELLEALVRHGVCVRDGGDAEGVRAVRRAVQEPVAPTFTVTAEREDALKRENPKGKLLELTQQRRLGAPTFAVTPRGVGFCCVATLALESGEMVVTSAHTARQAKLAEQSAAAELLERVAGHAPPSDARASEVVSATDPRVQLNEMRQIGLITSYAFEMVESRGPSHAPVFVVRGALGATDGATYHTDTVEGRSKKDAETRCAKALLTLAIERSR